MKNACSHQESNVRTPDVRKWGAQGNDGKTVLCACSVTSVVSHSFATLWIVACQSPLSMGFSRQEYWSGLPCPPPGDLPDTRIEPMSPALQVDSLPTEPPWEALIERLYSANTLLVKNPEIQRTSISIFKRLPLYHHLFIPMGGEIFYN